MFQFTDDCLIGIKELDDEHRRLFSLINQAMDILNHTDSNDRCTQITHLLEELTQYANTHFAHEEAYMELIRDPELIRQRMQHSLFRDKIRDFSFADIDDPGKQQQVVTDLLNFLAKWLYHHILGSDIMIGKLPPLEEWMIRDNPCEFTDDYLTGIEIVDLEHQQLFCIVERAYQLVKSNDVITCYDELLSIIHELTDYTVTHFADEEAYMEKIGYEGLAAQKNAHASFVARLESINLIELDENPQKYMESLIEFLLGWLINHILYSDKKIPVQA
jgi:hemerythrin